MQSFISKIHPKFGVKNLEIHFLEAKQTEGVICHSSNFVELDCIAY